MPENHQDEIAHGDDGWFKRHIIEGIRDLKDGQHDLAESVERVAEAMREHERSDATQFSSLKQGLDELAPVKRIVYSMVGLTMTAFFIALIAMVMKDKP